MFVRRMVRFRLVVWCHGFRRDSVLGFRHEKHMVRPQTSGKNGGIGQEDPSPDPSPSKIPLCLHLCTEYA